jgi:hypothetical protein
VFYGKKRSVSMWMQSSWIISAFCSILLGSMVRLVLSFFPGVMDYSNTISEVSNDLIKTLKISPSNWSGMVGNDMSMFIG